MYPVLLIVHVLICIALMAVVLLQSGKGGNLAGAFGVGGASQTLFGGRGAATFLTRATQYLGGAFFVTSLVLALLSRGTPAEQKSLIQREAARTGQTAPAPTGGQAPSAAPQPEPAASTPASTAPAPAPAGGGK